jgi:hypothetical protein
MPFKKVITSDGQPIVIGTTLGEDIKFPPGFCYRIGGLIYTVKEDVTQDRSSPMREISVSDGSTEIMTVASITNDLKAHGCQVMPMDKRFAKKEETQTEEVEVVEKKISKKKPQKTSVQKKVVRDKKVAKKVTKKTNGTK